MRLRKRLASSGGGGEPRTSWAARQVVPACAAAVLVLLATVVLGPLSTLTGAARAADNGPGGVGVHYALCQQWAAQIVLAEAKHGLPPMTLAAVGSRETGCRNITGDGGHGRGIWQRDDRFWKIPAGFLSDVALQADLAAQLLAANLKTAKGDWVGAFNVYNSGQTATSRTTGKNYGPDVLGRRDWLTARYGANTGLNVRDLVCPLPGQAFRDSYGEPRQGHKHQGVDIAAPIGTPVLALWDGTVTRTSNAAGGLGLRLASSNRPGQTLYLGHLNDYLVESGTAVRAGQPIAEVGNTGRSTGPHLHAETWTMNGGTIAARPNPYPLLNAVCTGAGAGSGAARLPGPAGVDLDADGRGDLVVGSRQDGAWNALLATGQPDRRLPLTRYAPGSPGAQLLVGQVSGDPRPERCSVQGATWACIDPDGRPLLLSAPSNDGGDTVMVADVTGPGGRPDGREDRVAVNTRTGVWATIDQDGRPGLLQAPGSPGAVVLAGDITGDGLSDRLSVDLSRAPVVWAAISGDGQPLLLEGPCASGPSQHPLLYDVDRDGREDRICFDDRDGTYAGFTSATNQPWLLPAPTIGAGTSAARARLTPVVADLDQDGVDELGAYDATRHRWVASKGSRGKPVDISGAGGPQQQPMMVGGSRTGFDQAGRTILGLQLTPTVADAGDPPPALAPATGEPGRSQPDPSQSHRPTPDLIAPDQDERPERDLPAPDIQDEPLAEQPDDREPVTRLQPPQHPHTPSAPQRQPPDQPPPAEPAPAREPEKATAPPTLSTTDCGANYSGPRPNPPPTWWSTGGTITNNAARDQRVTITAALTYPDGHVSSRNTVTVTVRAGQTARWDTGQVPIPQDDSHLYEYGGGCHNTITHTTTH